MTVLVCWAVVYILFAVYMNFNNKKSNIAVLGCLTAAALLIRILVACISRGYETDMNCFRSWSAYASGVLPWDFYDSVWCDYPPGYLYILSLMGFLRNIFPFAGDVWLKMPSAVCDILSAFLIFKTAADYNEGNMWKISVLYLFNVATVVNGAMWGQVDSVFTFFLLWSLILLEKEKYTESALLLGISISLKIQTLMFVPVYLFFVAEKFTGKKLILKLFKAVAVTIVTVIIIAAPFILKKGILFLINLYFGTATQYPYASLNAFNLFSLLGANLTGSGETFIIFSYAVWGKINICVSILICGLMYIKGKGAGKLYYCAGLLMLLIFAFSSDMHERYLFPAMAMFFMAGMNDKSKKTVVIALLVSVLQIINVGYLYYLSLSGTVHIPPDDKILLAGSFVTVVTAVYAAVYGFKKYMGRGRNDIGCCTNV